MSLNFGVGHIFYIIFLTFIESKLLPVANTEITNSIDNDDPSNDKGIINLTMPGTKWCGPGNTASNYDDLGKYKDADMCCRDHDHCDAIEAGQTKYNLTNTDVFTVLDCDCDIKFRECLRKINSKVSNAVGRMYFTARNRCYHNDHPIVRCEEYDTEMFLRRCIRYKLDETQSKRYQWFDIPLYSDKNERHALNDEEVYDV